MARSIVLRYDTSCVDCGATLSAGSTARWFGRGRVSCCGAGAPNDGRTTVPGAAYTLPPRVAPSVPSSAPLPRPAAAQPAPVSTAQRAALPAELATALACGCSPAHVAELARIAPNTRLLVRLSSGARFIVPAEHAAHVIRCIEESLVDRCRDVMGAAS